MSRAARYRPGGIAAARWDRISAFCLEAVTDANPGAADISRDWMLFVGRLVDWAHNTMGMPLDRDRIFHPLTIDSFISHNAPETWTPGTKGDGRARLMRVAEAVVSYSVRPHRLAPLTRGEPSRPYAADDVRLLVLWASWQNTPEKRQSARALVGLGLGRGTVRRRGGRPSRPRRPRGRAGRARPRARRPRTGGPGARRLGALGRRPRWGTARGRVPVRAGPLGAPQEPGHQLHRQDRLLRDPAELVPVAGHVDRHPTCSRERPCRPSRRLRA